MRTPTEFAMSRFVKNGALVQRSEQITVQRWGQSGLLGSGDKQAKVVVLMIVNDVMVDRGSISRREARGLPSKSSDAFSAAPE